MTRLAITSTILGAVVIAGRLPGVVAPASFREHMQKFPRSVLWVRILIGIVAGREGVPVSVTTGELPLFLGITLAAQNALIWLRAQETTIGTRAPAG